MFSGSAGIRNWKKDLNPFFQVVMIDNDLDAIYEWCSARTAVLPVFSKQKLVHLIVIVNRAMESFPLR